MDTAHLSFAPTLYWEKGEMIFAMKEYCTSRLLSLLFVGAKTVQKVQAFRARGKQQVCKNKK